MYGVLWSLFLSLLSELHQTTNKPLTSAAPYKWLKQGKEGSKQNIIIQLIRRSIWDGQLVHKSLFLLLQMPCFSNLLDRACPKWVKWRMQTLPGALQVAGNANVFWLDGVMPLGNPGSSLWVEALSFYPLWQGLSKISSNASIALRGLPFMMFAKFWGFWPPSPLQLSYNTKLTELIPPRVPASLKEDL